jgi:hypothetical protein
MLGRRVVFLRTACYMIHYVAFLLFLLCFVVLLSCLISWAYIGFLRGVLVFFRMWGRVLVFRLCSALGWLIIYMFSS